MSEIYKSIFRHDTHRRGVRFLVWLDEGASGPIVRISRSDAADPTDPLSDILVIRNHPVEIAIEHRNDSATEVKVTRMQQIKVPG